MQREDKGPCHQHADNHNNLNQSKQQSYNYNVSKLITST